MNRDIVICLLAAMFAADGVVGLIWGKTFQGFFGKVNIRRIAVLELVAAAFLLWLRVFTGQ